MIIDSCDVLVVGGGPAGSSLAGKLVQGGLDVVILDKSVFPRAKVCAGWVTPAVLDLLRIDRGAYSRERVLQEFTGFRTSMLGRPDVLTRYGAPVSYGIRRSEFDHYLLGRSRARLRLGEPLRSMERKNGSWLVNGSLRASLVIGAGGHFCPIARLLRGGSERLGPVVVAQEVEFKLDGTQQKECPVNADTPELFFCDDLTGYGWCVRKGDHLNVGLGREDSRDLPAQMQAFFDLLKQQGKVPAAAGGGFKGHAYALYRGAPRDIVDDGVLLVGDAVGLAHPQSGEGIRPAIESAFLAAEVILSAGRDFRRERLASYQQELSARFGSGAAAPAILPGPIRRFAARALMESSWFTRRVLLDRWFLSRRLPPLAVRRG